MRWIPLLILLMTAGEAPADEPWVQDVAGPVYFAVDVSDVDAAVQWYQTVFGVDAIDDTTADDGRWRIANLGNESFAIELIWDRRSSATEEGIRHHGFAKVGVGVPDVRIVADRVQAATAERPRVVESERHGIRILQLRDPDGNTIQLHSPLEEADSDDGFRDLFNGRDLSGWVLVNTDPSTWTVRDGMLICSGKPIGEIRTERMYQNFILEVEWRHMVPAGNGGIFIWADDITARGQPFHRSIEVQVLENAYGNTEAHTTHGDIFPIHGATMTPVNGRGGSRSFPTEHLSKPSPEWNHYRITAIDGDITLAVNGTTVTRGKESSPRKGYICLESEGGIVHYRNLRIKELPDTPIDLADVATADRGFRSLYNGLDLSGWTVEQGENRWTPDDWILSHRGATLEERGELSSEESVGNIGFVIDVRFSERPGTARLSLRASQTTVDLSDPSIAKHLAAAGSWNRFEGELQDNQLTLLVNDVEVYRNRSLDGVPPTGKLTLVAEGSADFANLYVRELN